MKNYNWTDWQNKAPLLLRKGTQSVRLTGRNKVGGIWERTSVTVAFQYSTMYYPNLSSVHDRIHLRAEGRFLLASLPDKRGLICLDRNNRVLMVTVRVKKAKRSLQDDIAFVQEVADGLATAAAYALDDMIDGTIWATGPSFGKLLIRSRLRKVDFFHINVSDALTSLDRENRLAA